MINGKNKKDLIKEGINSVNEFEKAWREFFKEKSKPRTDNEDIEQQKEFAHWYNYVRKQSDTKKTPFEMGGKRMMDFSLDEEEIELTTRTCPECEEFGLEITEDCNIYECKICGSVWQRLKPLNDGLGNMTDMPDRLKSLLKKPRREN